MKVIKPRLLLMIRLVLLLFFISINSINLNALDNISSSELSDKLVEETSRLVVNIPAREVTLYHHNNVIFQFPIAVGSPFYTTPVGDRSLKQIVWNPWWFPPDSPWARGAKPTPPGRNNPLGPVKMDLGGDIRMHGTNNEASIGHAVSHGCLRMKNDDAKTLARWIQEHHTDKTDPTLFDKYTKERGSSFYVNLEKPIPIKIIYDVFHIEGDKLSAHPDIYGRAGKKEETIFDYLRQRGYNPDNLYQNAFHHFMESAKKDSSTVSLRQLFPGTISTNENPPHDPYETAWFAKIQNTPQRKFSFLFSPPTL